MVKAIIITGWRNDIGAYKFDSYPEGYEIDEQDLMNLYNMHRFRDTRANFQVLISPRIRLASFYSGGYNSPYVGRPNFAVSLVLEPDENPDDFEKPLRIITNNLLIHLDDPDFTERMAEILEMINSGRINEIKIERKQVSAPKPKEIITTDKIGAKLKKKEKEKDIFDELLETVNMTTKTVDFDDDIFNFDTAASASQDPFGGSGSVFEDPFGGSSSSGDPFAGDPFKEFEVPAQPSGTAAAATAVGAPSVTPVTPTTGTGAELSGILNELESLDRKMPKPPTEKTPEKLIPYFEQKIAVLEQKLSAVSKLAKIVQQKDAEIEKKNRLIAKLLKLIS